jgi:aminoglycoside N3'-acetyltransferase/aminopeptidase-like protein
MPRTPSSLNRFNKQVLPVLHKTARGGNILRLVKAIQETDQWNSFDRFHDTTRTLVTEYEAAGAKTEVREVLTGGRIGSGRWIIQEAEDFRSITADIISPVKKRIVDYSKNPWQVIQWSAATPREGITAELMVVDTKEQLEQLRAPSVQGKIILTSLNPRSLLPELSRKGAAAVITDRLIPNNPKATSWTKFGWGGIPISDGPVRMVGLVLSSAEGRQVRQLHQKHGGLRVRIKADIRRYTGTHDVVSGIVKGALNPQDEVWAIAHSAEPGAVDNASGGAVCIEIARILESLIQEGKLPRPKRTIRLLHGYECYGFFDYLENEPRLQPPMAGVCIDTVGAKPKVCDGILGWHATLPMSAGFVDRVGESILRASLRCSDPGYRYRAKGFVSTSDTLIGDPKYGFPCPWLTTHFKKEGNWDAYHSGADQPHLLSGEGLAMNASAMAGYLYFLADAGSSELVQIAETETDRALKLLAQSKKDAARKRFIRDEHRTNIERLKAWIWEGDRAEVLDSLHECSVQVENATSVRPLRATKSARRIPRRKAPLSPTMENTPESLAEKFKAAGLWDWVLFYADGNRNLAQIAEAASCERNKKISIKKVTQFFEAQAELGYVDLTDEDQLITKSRLISDLKSLGLTTGMDVIVHSSLSALGEVIGGAETVVDALLSVIGKSGTLMMPSFNHRAAYAYHPSITPTTNGAIPDAMWRRPGAARSIHPTHAVAAIGPKARQYCEGHLEIGIWEAESPIGRLIHGGGYILALGVTHYASTAYHVAEVSMNAGCLDPFASQHRIIDESRQLKIVPGLAWRGGTCPVSPRKLDEALTKRKLNKTGKVGNGESGLVKAIDLWNLRRAHLKGVCDKCKIKPVPEMID